MRWELTDLHVLPEQYTFMLDEVEQSYFKNELFGLNRQWQLSKVLVIYIDQNQLQSDSLMIFQTQRG